MYWWPFGNEYHSICCGTSGIIFGIEMVEGKDHPKEIPADPTNEKGNTIGLLLRHCLCKQCYAKHVMSLVIDATGGC